MTHFYEKNIVEIKTEYTTFLSNILTPLIYEGLKKIYLKSVEVEKKFQSNPDVENPGILRIFQTFLKGIKNINNHNIEAESDRIKEKSKCSEWFDDLIKAVVKSYIVLLTYNASGKSCHLVHEKFHETIDTKTFIHKCYIECARLFFNYPELFWHGFTTIEIKRNQREAHDLIRIGINEAIRKMLPMKLILEEYLKNDYLPEDETDSDIPENYYQNMRIMVNKDLYPNDNLILEETDDEYGEQIEKMTNQAKNLDNDEMVDVKTLMMNQNNQTNNLSNQTNQPTNQSNQSNNQPNNIFGKVDERHTVEDNTVDEQQEKLNMPGYIKEPVAIRGGNKFILNEEINKYKNIVDNKQDNQKLSERSNHSGIVNPQDHSIKNLPNTISDADIDINVNKKTIRSDRSAFYDKLMNVK
jgi:hypothetical protein